MHLKRWLTSLVALPLLVLLIFKGGLFLFSLFAGIVAVLAIWEYTRIVTDGFSINTLFCVSFLVTMALIWAVATPHASLVPPLLSLGLLLTGCASLKHFRYDPDIYRKVALQVMGIIYIPLAISYSIIIRQEPFGAEWVFFIACVIFAGDTGAYYTGTFLGKYKLCPSVSPGKTVEGAVGGLAANLIVGVVFNLYFLPSFPLIGLLLFSLAIGIAGQVGDLFESVLKRSAGVKDSGGILPGHGGILDRIDAILFALPVAYFIKVYFLTQQIVR